MIFLRIVHNIVRCTLAVSYILVTVRMKDNAFHGKDTSVLVYVQ